ncbi:MAG: TetR/AcrR family transcriptional regulator [Clostridium sp.]|jgi:AcrR family transcriptional regulator|uniref:TetR/AcrR family transcriptional regulator n=1 Tax=Clostridium sp. TaxID=1506 RepID=UPI0025B8AE47|nr:TetR/AcrR family transcriptional regulator [Clostridium sp.]MCH3965532.1 TetR/AcrR family transcriptional regulator [Clostridium sp.]MCI1716861.1 TetR/AcrR family transcriptional regulator [Clostridium sp.]MCI1801209.1 TetR/AcrR family transcriptional regulator [Clostridium sp.]MCI1815047.1 TetR/AcrR family transcriptional regulator [Clostridium sp.]MCI1871948.1 TetR/AcrR family transcriptional regulator [Clostridium sp.]
MNSKSTKFKFYSERRDAAENRQRILNAAVKLFEEYGVEQVSMNQIANEAGVGSGTLYRRYRNKGELCLDLIKDNADLLFDGIQEYLDQNHSDPPNQRLKEVLRLFICFREKKAQLLTGVEAAPSNNSLKSKMTNPLFDELHQILVKLFDAMNENDHTHFDSIFRADMLLMALSRDYYSFQRDVRHYTPEMILKQLCEIFI